MSQQDQVVIEFDPNAPPLVFTDWDKLQKWFDSERAQWAWLVRGDGVTDLSGVSTHVQNNFDAISNTLGTLRSRGNPVSSAQDALTNLNATGPIFCSEAPGGKLVLDIRERAGEAAGAYAYAFSKQVTDLRHAKTPDQLLGALMTALPEMVRPAELSAQLKQERERYRNSLRSAMDRVEKSEKVRAEEAVSLLGRAKSIGAQALRIRQKRWDASRTMWGVNANDAVNSIRAVEATYRESMGLQAPVEYWNTKATTHRTKEQSLRRWLVGYFILTGIAMAAVFGIAGNFLLNHTVPVGQQQPIALYLVVTGGLTVLSTLAFWIGRVLMKLYLSEHHLRNDAEERAVMTTTYLALKHENAASDAERQIILSALFRNAPDGIVKDDGPSDGLLQALLNRASLPR